MNLGVQGFRPFSWGLMRHCLPRYASDRIGVLGTAAVFSMLRRASFSWTTHKTETQYVGAKSGTVAPRTSLDGILRMCLSGTSYRRPVIRDKRGARRLVLCWESGCHFGRWTQALPSRRSYQLAVFHCGRPSVWVLPFANAFFLQWLSKTYAKMFILDEDKFERRELKETECDGGRGFR
ncbi:hypothetical protein HGRIS_000649 [Hohenbuehelia grisea]|uniref:Uncharacterized protein n=1 Tax=Hohenbuehelia grisea TaxID=104357 RepID=A0ABR3JSK7_9AGAR